MPAFRLKRYRCALAVPPAATLLAACSGAGSGGANRAEAIRTAPANPMLSKGLVRAPTATSIREDASTLNATTQGILS